MPTIRINYLSAIKEGNSKLMQEISKDEIIISVFVFFMFSLKMGGKLEGRLFRLLLFS